MVWSLTKHCKNARVRAAVTRSTATRRREGNDRQHIHGPTGTTPGELAARSLSLCAYVFLPCITGVLEPGAWATRQYQGAALL
jgi:hypothetical protein